MNRNFHLLFEQSGTFKNEFKKLGYEAFDYDILNDFNETNYVIDLFKEIEKGYENKPSIFDDIAKRGGEIMAFFPCIMFSEQQILQYKGKNNGMKKWDKLKLLEYGIELQENLNKMFALISKLVIICIKKKIPLIIENPYGTQHYLVRYWSIEATIIDKDRTFRGDYFVKPTQYFFINRKPSNNFIMEAMVNNERKTVSESNKVERSMISKEYASRFIREFIL